MAFNLFGSKKEKLEQQQTKEIKEATKIPQIKTEPVLNQVSSENNFVNPFSNEQNSKTQIPKLNLDTTNPIENNLNQTENNQLPFPNQINNNNNTPNENLNNSNKLNNTQLKNNIFQNENLNNPINSNDSNINPFNQINDTNQKNSVQDLDQIQEMIDETVEKLIEEKWEKLIGSVEKVLKWKEKQEKQMILIKEDIVSMSENLDLVEKKIINKVSSYDKNILDVNSEIKALEKVFQKITPTLINNVNELSKIADDFKDAKIENKKLENN